MRRKEGRVLRIKKADFAVFCFGFFVSGWNIVSGILYGSLRDVLLGVVVFLVILYGLVVERRWENGQEKLREMGEGLDVFGSMVDDLLESVEEERMGLVEELDTFDAMIGALVELLEERGVLERGEWRQRMRQLVGRRAKSVSCGEVE